jgi:hypothetical protein
MRTLEQLNAIEDIKQLKARYFYCLDHKDWDGWRNEVFAADASMLVEEVRPEPYVGIETILDFLIPLLTPVKTIHHGHMPMIEITSPTTAKGVWAMEDVLFWPENAGSPHGATGRVHGYGHYHETYELTAGGWRIKSLRLTRLLSASPLI